MSLAILPPDPDNLKRASSRYPAPVRTIRPISEYALTEGEPLGASITAIIADATGLNVSGAGYYLGAPTLSNVSRAYWLESVTITSNRAAYFRFQVVGPTAYGTWPTMDFHAIVQPGNAVTIPIRRVASGGMGEFPAVYLKEYLDSTLTGVRVSVAISGQVLSDDLNFGAAKPLLFIGDSIWNGTGPTTKENFIPWMIRKYYTDAGEDVRMLNQSISGSTSVGHEVLRARGRYDHRGLGAIFYSLGANDAVQAISAATYQANVAAFIAWKQRQYPQIPLVIFGCTPHENNTNEAAAALIRTAGAAAVTAANDSKVKFCDLGNSFNRATSANYVGSDTPGSRIHPSDTGIGLEWNGGYNGNIGIKAWLDANLPML